jgi:hypothetical protein
MMIVVGSSCGRNFNIGNNRAAAHCLPFGGNQPITEAERPEAGGIGDILSDQVEANV